MVPGKNGESVIEIEEVDGQEAGVVNAAGGSEKKKSGEMGANGSSEIAGHGGYEEHSLSGFQTIDENMPLISQHNWGDGKVT